MCLIVASEAGFSSGKRGLLVEFADFGVELVERLAKRSGQGIVGREQDILGRFDAALTTYQEALQLAREIEDKRALGTILLNFGVLRGPFAAVLAGSEGVELICAHDRCCTGSGTRKNKGQVLHRSVARNEVRNAGVLFEGAGREERRRPPRARCGRLGRQAQVAQDALDH